MRFFGRLAHLAAAVLQGILFAALTPCFGGLVGMAVGYLTDHVRQGGLIGLAVGAVLVVFGFATAVQQSVGLRSFLEWWFRAAGLPELALGMAVASYFLQLRLTARLGVQWPSGTLQVVCGALALWLWLPTSFAILNILFPPPGLFLDAGPSRGGLTPFRDILTRASHLGGTRREAPRGRRP